MDFKKIEFVIKNHYNNQLASHLKENGFSAELVHFPGINMLLTLPKGCYFRDDGFVDCIASHVLELDKYFGNVSIKKDYSRAKGLCYNHNSIDDGIRISVIYQLDIENKYSNVMIQGHESVHAIMNFGILGQFLNKLLEKGFTVRPLSDYDVESTANLGAIIAHYNLYQDVFNNHSEVKSIYNEVLYNSVDKNVFKKNISKFSSRLHNLLV